MRRSPRRERGLTFLEIMIAASLLAVVMLAVLSTSATQQRVIGESSDQIIAANEARNMMELLLQAQWAETAAPAPPGLLNYYHNYLNSQTDSFPVPVPGYQHGYSSSGTPLNTLGTLIVREPDNVRFPGEFPAYNQGRPHIAFGPRPSGSRIPVPPNPAAPTLLLLIVKVNIPAGANGRAGASVELRTTRSFL